MGMRLEEIGVPEKSTYDLHLFDNLPSGHPFFTKFMLSIAPSAGLFHVNAWQEFHDGNASEVNLRGTFEELRGAFEEFFGNSTTVDESRFNEGTHCLELSAAWTRSRGARLYDDVTTVILSVHQDNRTYGTIKAQFFYSNFLRAQSEVQGFASPAPTAPSARVGTSAPAHEQAPAAEPNPSATPIATVPSSAKAPNPEPIKRTVTTVIVEQQKKAPSSSPVSIPSVKAAEPTAAPAPPSVPTKVPTERKVTSVVVGGQQTGPFGLRMGMPPGVLGQPQRVVSSSVLEYDTLPQGHDLFNKYRLTFCSMIGLCHVAALRMGITMSDGGYTLASQFRNVVSKYEALYGPYWKRDQTVSSSYTSYISIIAVWTSGSTAGLPKDVASIEIEALRTADSEGVVRVNYYYTNSTMSKDQIQRTSIAEPNERGSEVSHDRFL
jgi:hypothetical protein